MAPQERNPYKKCERKGVWGKEGECEENFLEPSGHAGKVPQERLHLRAGAVFCPPGENEGESYGGAPQPIHRDPRPPAGVGGEDSVQRGVGDPRGRLPPSEKALPPLHTGMASLSFGGKIRKAQRLQASVWRGQPSRPLRPALGDGRLRPRTHWPLPTSLLELEKQKAETWRKVQ